MYVFDAPQILQCRVGEIHAAGLRFTAKALPVSQVVPKTCLCDPATGWFIRECDRRSNVLRLK